MYQYNTDFKWGSRTSNLWIRCFFLRKYI